MKEQRFRLTDGSCRQLDQIMARCGHENYASVLGSALGLYDALTAHAADGVQEITITVHGPQGRRLSVGLTHTRLDAAYQRAREQERQVLPAQPVSVKPAPAPPPSAPAPVTRRPWWRWWGR